MTVLASHLSFVDHTTQAGSSKDAAYALPPLGTHVVVSDSLNSPADFVLGHFVFAAVGRKRPVVLVDFRLQGRAAWESLGRKLHTSLPPATSSDWTHILPSSFGEESRFCPDLYSPEPTLLPTLLSLKDALSAMQPASEPVIVIDGADELLNMGFTAPQVARFTRAVAAECRPSAVLITRIHADHLDGHAGSHACQEDLLKRLLHTVGGTWWRVGRLDSGRSGEVMGEISCHPNYTSLSAAKHDTPTVGRAQPLQYRLTDTSVKVFAKGTGRGFL